MKPRLVFLAMILIAAGLASGCKGLTSGGSIARLWRKEEASAGPMQPTSLQPAQTSIVDRDLSDDIRRAAFTNGEDGAPSMGSPPMPPFVPNLDPLDDRGGHVVEGPYGSFDRFQGGGHYLDRGPAVSGEMLARERAVTATERALELAEQLDVSRAEKAQLQSLIEELQRELQAKNELLQRAQNELASAREDLADSEESIKRWAEETEALRERMEEREKAHEKTFNELVELINAMIDKQRTPSAGAVSSH